MSNETMIPCRDPQYDPDDWFTSDSYKGAGKKRNPKALEVKARCMQDCPLYQSCAEYALKEGVPFGIWGGMSGEDRAKVWKADWRQYPKGRPDTFEKVMSGLLPQTNSIKRAS